MPDNGLEQDGVVRDLTIEHNGQTHSAVYFVEHGQIHVKTGERLYRLPKSDMPSSEAVRNLLLGLISDTQRKRDQAASWTDARQSEQD